MDESMVTDMPFTTIRKMPATVNNIKYPPVGAKSHHVTLGVYDLKHKQLPTWKLASLKKYLTNITWSPEEDYIYMAIVNRGQNHFLNRYNAENGMLDKTLSKKETSDMLNLNMACTSEQRNQQIHLAKRERWLQPFIPL
jgi:dipeptidyl-peptidase-4